MVTVIISAIIIFGTAMLGLGVGAIFKKRGLGSGCCARHNAAGRNGDDISCPSCSARKRLSPGGS